MVTARSEWDVDKAILQPLSMTFFLQTKPINLTIQVDNEKHIISTNSWKKAYIGFLNFVFSYFVRHVS